MSRSALWNQSAKRQERAQQHMSLVAQTRSDGISNKSIGTIETIGNQETFNINQMLFNNVLVSPYFLKLCEKVKDNKTLIDEIYYKVTDITPWSTGTSRIPSSCFCCLVRLCLMTVTENQLWTILKHVDSPYIRAVGFLFARYCAPTDLMWKLMKDFVYDEEEFTANGTNITIGAFVRSLVEDIEFYGTILPRIPVMQQRHMKAKMLQEGENYERMKVNLDICQKEFYRGATVRGLYEDDENPLKWYECVIDEVVEPKEEWETHEYWVTFTQYGNQEKLKLGEMEPSYMNSSVVAGYEAVLEKEKLAAQSTGKNYARQVLGMKSSMALKKDSGLHGGSEMDREQSLVNRANNVRKAASTETGSGGRGDGGAGAEVNTNKRSRERTDEEIEEAKIKRSKLISKYG